MQTNITFRNLNATESIKSYAREKVDRVNKYLDKASEAHVVLALERHLHHADITIHAGTFFLRGRELRRPRGRATGPCAAPGRRPPARPMRPRRS